MKIVQRRCDFCGEAKPDVEIAGFDSVSNNNNYE